MNNEWRLCSEKLPETNDEVLTTYIVNGNTKNVLWKQQVIGMMAMVKGIGILFGMNIAYWEQKQR